MAESVGTPNKNFEREMIRYNRGRTPGTAEYAHRLDYPGDAAQAHVCLDNECVNFERPILETYWICPECYKAAPCNILYLTHVPYKILPSKKKRKAAAAAAFSVWCKNRPRKPIEDE